MAEFYPLLFGRGFSLPQLLFFAASPHPCAGPQYRPLRPPAGFFSPPGSIAVRRAVNIYYQ